MPANAPAAHRTVLAQPAVDHLITDPGGSYADATFGRGGHSRRILERLSDSGRLIALDRDPAAAKAAMELADPRFHFVCTRFSRLSGTLATLGVRRLQGLLLDLGVSSPQIDEAARGFSWRADAPLDMRMDTAGGGTAAEWLAAADADELTRVIRDYGEERLPRSSPAQSPSAAAGMRPSIRRREPFRLYGFTSIRNSRSWR